MSDKIFRDPLYNYVTIVRKRHGWLIDLLNCPEVQRLRRIHQLGVSYLTYPGADHNRLAHSLGVVHLMQKVVMTRWSAVTAVRITSASIATRPPSMKRSAPPSASSIKRAAK